MSIGTLNTIAGLKAMSTSDMDVLYIQHAGLSQRVGVQYALEPIIFSKRNVS